MKVWCCFTLGLLTLAAGAVTARAQSNPTFDINDHFITLTRLGTHLMPNLGDGDSMSRPFWLDMGTQTPYGSQGLMETWYIARDPVAGTAPFYSLNNPSIADHMDSAVSSEGSYSPDLGQPHGYAWLTDQGGMKPLSRSYNAAINDHRTWLFSETPR